MHFLCKQIMIYELVLKLKSSEKQGPAENPRYRRIWPLLRFDLPLFVKNEIPIGLGPALGASSFAGIFYLVRIFLLPDPYYVLKLQV